MESAPHPVVASEPRSPRIAGLTSLAGTSLEAVERRRFQLWGLTLLLLAACAAGFALVPAFDRDLLPDGVGTSTLRAALVLLIALFSAYAIDAELRLRALTRRLLEEQVLTTALTQRLAEVSALLQAGRTISLELHFDEVLQTVLRSARELLDARDCSLQLVQGEEELRTVGLEGNSNAGGARMRFGEGIAGRVAATREPLLIEGTIPGLVKQPHLAPPGSAMCVPILYRDTLLGVMNVNAKGDRRYTTHDLRSFATFADHAGIALANAQLYENQRHRSSAERFESLHDPLTGLANRNLLLDRLNHSLTRRRSERERIALLVIDLDDFRRVNETLGHHAGDELLAAFAERIRAVVRSGDTLGRLGSDELGLVAEPIRDTEEAIATAARILARLEAPFRVSGRDVTITACIGLTVAESKPAAELLREANLALRAAKALGVHQVVLFEPELEEEGLDRLDLEDELRDAIAHNRLEVHYQPIVRLDTRAVVAAEALVRWPHAKRGLMGAGAFVPLAEQLGLLPAIDRIVVEESLAFALRIDAELGLPLRIATNFAPSRLREVGLVSEVRDTLDRIGLPPDRFVLEVTESSILRDIHAAATRLSALRALGISLSLDDFGTGFSSLTHLQRFPVDGVKIDRSFVSGLDDGSARDLVDGVLRLAQGMRLEVVAEGVEHEEQAEILQSLGCPLAQGFHLGRPMVAREFRELVARTR